MVLPIILAGCSSESVTYEEKSYSASVKEIQTITIDVNDRKIEVFPSESQEVRITYSESDKDFYNINLSEEKELLMTATSDKDWKDYIGKKATKEARTIQIWLPDKLIENITLKTSNEEIELPPLSVTGAVNIKVNNGDIQLDKLSVGTTLTLETKNGEINGTIQGLLDEFTILSKAKKGKSNLPESKGEGDKKLDVSTNNGNINLEFTE